MIKYKKIGSIILIIVFVCVIIGITHLYNNQKEYLDNIIIDEYNSNYMNNENSDEIEIEKQLNVILKNKELWYKDTEFDKYSYAVTDLDQNGRVEIISSICQGTGIYTYTKIYEINENIDGLTLCETNLQEYDSQADIIKNNWKVFYDNTNKKYHYIFDDLTKNGMTEYYENKRDFCLSNGKIEENYLARKNTIYQNGLPEVTCTDLNDNEISEEQYNNFENQFLKGFEKMNVNIEWLNNNEEINFENLKDSYNNFAFSKVNE